MGIFYLYYSFFISILYGEQAKYFKDEITPKLRHNKAGTVSLANKGKDKNGSQFFITTKDDLKSLDDTCTIFGQVAEGMDVVDKINKTIVDENFRPLKNIRILHTMILDDPFEDPKELIIPPNSPEPDVC